MRRRFNRVDFDLHFGDGVDARRGAADRAFFADGQVYPRNAVELAVEEVDAADLLLRGGAVGRAVDVAGKTDLGVVRVELVEDALNLTNGDRVECQQGAHDRGVVGPRFAFGDRLFWQQAIDADRVANDVDQVELLARQRPVWAVRHGALLALFHDDGSFVVGQFRRAAGFVDFDDGLGLVVIANGQRSSGRGVGVSAVRRFSSYASLAATLIGCFCSLAAPCHLARPVVASEPDCDRRLRAGSRRASVGRARCRSQIDRSPANGYAGREADEAGQKQQLKPRHGFHPG